MFEFVMKCLLVAVVAYGLGSLSFAYIITKIKTGKDIRTIGSGNAGFSNALRILSRPWAFLVFFLDVLKGYIAGWVGLLILGPTGGIIGLAMAIVGHTYPFYFQFKGGKGIATGLGGLLAVTPLIGISMLSVWGVVLLFSRYISLGSVAAAISMPIFAIIFKQPVVYLVTGLLVASLVIYKHIPNLKRIMNKTEPKIFQKK